MQPLNITISRLAYIVGLALTVLVVSAPAAAAGAQGERFIPGVTDFPSRVEVAAEANEFVPGVSDFPSRLGETGEAAAEARLAQRSQQAPTVELQIEDSGFDWGAGASGALAATLLLLAAGLAVRTAKRSRIALG